jgi:hypothetical protein
MLPLRTQQQPQCRFDQFRHCAAPARGLTLQLGHHGVDFNIENMAMWLAVSCRQGVAASVVADTRSCKARDSLSDQQVASFWQFLLGEFIPATRR